MKHFKLLFLLLCVSFGRNTEAQNFDIQSFELKYKYVYYTFTIGNYYYFKNYNDEFIRVNKSSPSKIEEFTIKPDSDDEAMISLFETNGKIFGIATYTEDKVKSVAKSSTTSSTKSSTTTSNTSTTSTVRFRTKIYLYLYDEMGNKVKKVFQKVNKADSFEIDYKYNFDDEIVYIYQKDSVIQAYGFDLIEKSNKKLPKYHSTEGSTYNFLDAFKVLFKNLNINFGLDADLSFLNTGLFDTTKFEHYAVSYMKNEKEMAHFDKYYTNLTVHTNNDGKLGKEIEVDLGSDKLIVEAEYRILKNTNILIFGKYMEKTTSANPMYGIFSCVLNKSLDFVKDVQTQELTRVNNEGPVVLNRYVGFILTKLHMPKKAFHIKKSEEEMFISTHQVTFKNFVDHIYILRVSETGEMDINQIGTNTATSKSAPDYHAAFKLKNKIIFYFYDNPENINNKATDMTCKMTKPGKKSNLLVACYYDYVNNEFSQKFTVSDRKTLKVCPVLSDSYINTDEENGVYTSFFLGKDKKGNIKKMYLIKYGE